MELIGAFGLTEPDIGSAISAGLATSAKRDGDEWVLNGEKKWIGNAAFADLVVIWARDEDDGQVKGFVVEKDTEGMTFDKQEDKIALRVVQNAEIHLHDVRVPEANRLQRADSFRSTANVLRVTRMSVAWQAAGCARGAFEHALRYTKARQQFGRPIASFQLVQDLLVKMLGNGTLLEHRRQVRRRRRGDLLLRVNPRDQHPHRRPRDHGRGRLPPTSRSSRSERRPAWAPEDVAQHPPRRGRDHVAPDRPR
jgi:alkylation response protein AidB-like acyl-CoA dehydrogenase